MPNDNRLHFAIFSGVLIIILSLTALAVGDVSPRVAQAEPPTEMTGLVTLTPTLVVTPSRTPFPTATLILSPTPSLVAAPTRTPAASRQGQVVFGDPQPTPQGDIATRELRVPILMYHYVEPLPEIHDQLRVGLTVTPEDFRLQLQYIRDMGYTPIDLYTFMDGLATGAPLPPKPIVLTFDDGYLGLYEHAFPIMQEFGYTGTIFLITQLMDEGFPQFLTWEQAREMAAAGWRLEPHTKTHASLEGRGRDFVIYQILGSLETISYHTGYQPRFFAYPGGAFDGLTVEIVRELGFWAALTTQAGQIHVYENRFTLSRIRVNGRETLADLAIRLGEPIPTATPTLPPTITPTPTVTPPGTPALQDLR